MMPRWYFITPYKHYSLVIIFYDVKLQDLESYYFGRSSFIIEKQKQKKMRNNRKLN